ncbi:UDP-N-acetyl-D-galactosamine dehydrogenase [Parabacteroides sp. PFB2-12]|uniref:nucleotide sugar dehydrogenase n=1 Tax=unclassified Parabacteroides TaxID=2649774 RepID=UPI002476B8C3|nr:MULTISPECIES: nucleotide sugar dehydrogenase [unclassified Parabacteroides]MDH6341381.1 UDP-N-acetyl-D-galactosamine dehydrogenase [Parabacteroides sp. PM6-13]MDH6389175.1 UDP-N-acetyl-D-galactosamine dehydrogenase [Parabacteroides sp. PFB2-12]
MYKALIGKEKKLAVIGQGYVGLPLAMAFARHLSVIGYDIDKDRLEKLQQGMDPGNEVSPEEFEGKDILFTSSVDDLRRASFYIIAVPTPIDRHNQPDLTALLSATRQVGQVLKQGDYVVYESTVYPGCTEEDCIPLLEQASSLKAGKDFHVGYSPERINPGDQKHTLSNTIKIVSASDEETLDTLEKVYGLIVEAGLHCTPSIKVAEAAKIIENTQRDVNIALMNELSIIFDRMGINTYDVLRAAGTKWNFQPYTPGLVGGHCVGVDPYYMVYKARELNYHPKMINSGRFVNDSMGGYIGKKIVKRMIAQGKNILGARALVMGLTFKENVSDIRNSKVVDIINELKDYGMEVDVTDPYASPEEVEKQYGLSLKKQPKGRYDAIIVAVSHKEYLTLSEEWFLTIANEPAVLGDVKGIYQGRIAQMAYWSL